MTKKEKATYAREWRNKNKEKAKASSRQSYKKNKEKILAQQKKYQLNNKDKKIKYNETYYKKLNLANADISQRTLTAWAIQVKKRDNYTCQLCGSNDKLHAHHILSKSKHSDYALFLNNGITLCEKCHMEEHTLNGDI